MALNKNEHEITVQGFLENLRKLNTLKTVDRENVKQKIIEARAQGDLSENADYDAARDEQAVIEGKILEIEQILKTAIVRMTKDEEKKLRDELDEKRKSQEDILKIKDIDETNYNALKDQLPELEKRIYELDSLFKKDIKHENPNEKVVATGKIVTFKYEGIDKEFTFEFVGQYEVDIEQDEANKILKISIDSPIGKSLKGKKIGEKVTFQNEKGKTLTIKILKIE